MKSVKDQRKLLLTLGSLLIIISPLGVGIQYLTTPPPLTSDIKLMPGGLIEPYESIEAMARAPEVDLIIRGAITYVTYQGVNYRTESKYLFTPYWVIKGPPSLFGPIWVLQSGGVNTFGETYIWSGNPLMQVGEELILFLKEIERNPGKYKVVGRTQGRFMVQGGRVYSFGEVYDSSDERVLGLEIWYPSQLHTGGISEREFVSQIHSALGNPSWLPVWIHPIMLTRNFFGVLLLTLLAVQRWPIRPPRR